MNTKIEQVDVVIEEPVVHQVTVKSNPKIWALLQPPEQAEFINQWPAALRKLIE